MIEVTTKAQEKLGEYMKKNKMESPVRVYLAQGGDRAFVGLGSG
jgi:Fe-S cluster assembly iron-binding protein IscA